MIKKLKKPCYVVLCDNCGEDVFGYSEYNPHFETKQDALEAFNYNIFSGKLNKQPEGQTKLNQFWGC